MRVEGGGGGRGRWGGGGVGLPAGADIEEALASAVQFHTSGL